MVANTRKILAWQNQTILTYGFRPFFLGGTLYAILAMLLWIGMLFEGFTLPTRFDPISWHAHEFLYGYLMAIEAGFLLTAVPNWSGRPPLTGWSLAALFMLWLIGRVAMAISALISLEIAILADLSMPLVLLIIIAYDIICGKSWRNLIIIGIFLVQIVGNVIFHLEVEADLYAADGYGFRIGLATAIMMIAIIGGRIIPIFTRNWLIKNNDVVLPAPPSGFDIIALIFLFLTLIIWILVPENQLTGILLILNGLVHFARLLRWAGYKTIYEPLVLVLHVGYFFISFGAFALGGAILTNLSIAPAAQHLWMTGGIGLMTLAVMTRATLGHTGRVLHADFMTTGIYLFMITAALSRFAAGFFPDISSILYIVTSLCWIASFSGFVGLYGPMLLRPHRQSGA